MKAEIVHTSRPALKAGQIWKNKAEGGTYLAVEAGTGPEITLVSMRSFASTWAYASGFGGADDSFEYVGELKLKED